MQPQASSSSAPPRGSQRLCCTWYASQTISPSLSSGKDSGAQIWIDNTTLFVRIGMSPGIRAYPALMCLYQQDASGFTTDRVLSGHLLQATATDETCTPGNHATAWLCPGWRTSGARGWPGAAKTWTAFINMVLIYSKPSPESQTLGTAVSGDKWLLLNGVVPRCRASLVVSLSPNFISLNKVLLLASALSLSKQSLDKINRYYRDVCVVCVCVHASGKWKSFSNG